MLSMLTALFLAIILTDPEIARSEPRNTIKLGTRTFDLGADVSFMREYEDFIPVSRVPRINAFMDTDPLLKFVVMLIKSNNNRRGDPTWIPDNKTQHLEAPDIAEFWGIFEYYDVRWYGSTRPSHAGTIIIMPKRDNVDFVTICGLEASELLPTTCTTVIKYPPDASLRIHVRDYARDQEVSSLSAMAERALALIYCLDVTDQLSDMPQAASEAAAVVLSPCKGFSS